MNLTSSKLSLSLIVAACLGAGQPKPQTQREFECYIQSAEARMDARKAFVLADDDKALNGQLVGEKRIIMGSDYPHVEGLTEPASYIKDLENFDYTPQQCRTVMRDNGLELSVRRPV